MGILKTDAIPIKISEYSETSIIASFLTRDFGVVKAVFKGARRKSRAYENTVDILLPGELVFYERGSGLNIIKEYAPRENYAALGNDLERYGAALACLEFVRSTAVEGENAQKLFELFGKALEACSKGDNPRPVIYSFILGGLSLEGFLPAFDRCAICGSGEFPDPSKARTAFSFVKGGALCIKCGRGSRVEKWLGGPLRNALGKLLKTPISEAGTVKLDSKLDKEMRGFLKRWCEFTFEHRFKMLN